METATWKVWTPPQRVARRVLPAQRLHPRLVVALAAVRLSSRCTLASLLVAVERTLAWSLVAEECTLALLLAAVEHMLALLFVVVEQPSFALSASLGWDG